MVNLSNSQFFFSSNIQPEISFGLTSKFRVLVSLDMGVSQGMPLLHKRVGQRTYHFLVEKVRRKLSAWKAQTMSMVIRALLVQSSTSTTVNYAIQTSLLPIHTLGVLRS